MPSGSVAVGCHHSVKLLELAEATLDGIAFPVPSGVERGRAASVPAALTPVSFWSSLTGMTALMPRRRR